LIKNQILIKTRSAYFFPFVLINSLGELPDTNKEPFVYFCDYYFFLSKIIIIRRRIIIINIRTTKRHKGACVNKSEQGAKGILRIYKRILPSFEDIQKDFTFPFKRLSRAELENERRGANILSAGLIAKNTINLTSSAPSALTHKYLTKIIKKSSHLNETPDL
jgi:hypothetical protein